MAAPGATPLPDAKLFYKEGEYDEVPHDSMRKTIAKRLTSAKSLIPHFYLTIDCNIDELMAAGGFPGSGFLADYAALAAAGQLTIPVAKKFPLTQWRAAAELSLSGAPHGKVVLVP